MAETGSARGASGGGYAGSSEARRLLALLIAECGTDDALVLPKSESDPEGPDLPPGSALRWPKCRCGSPKCPDYEPPRTTG